MTANTVSVAIGKKSDQSFGVHFFQPTSVHIWLDELFQTVGPPHRKFRHHVEGIEEVRKMWGDEAALAAKIHIIVDCWGIPSMEDYENEFVNQFGQDEESTWEEALMMLKAVAADQKA